VCYRQRRKIKKNMFEKITGQERAKRRLQFFAEGQSKTGISPHILFVAPRGCGKTLLAQAYAKELFNENSSKRKLLTINCSSLTKVSQFINDIVIPHVVDKEITILFDEASEIPRSISMALLTILNPTKENQNTYSFGDLEVVFDFSKVTFLFATTEAHLLFHALTDRLERIDLEEYSADQLATIIKKNIEAPITDAAMTEIGQVLRGNARKAAQMANHISIYLNTKSKTTFDIHAWHDFSFGMGIRKLGLTSTEVKLLRCLSERLETTLTVLSSKMSMTRQAVQQDTESYLQKLDLIEIAPAGRRLTRKGRDYLNFSSNNP